MNSSKKYSFFFSYPFLAIIVLVIIWSLIYLNNGRYQNDAVSIFHAQDGIGVIELKGLIVSSKDYIEDIEYMEDNKQVKGVILKINSPGGGVSQTYEIFQALERLSKKKKVYVSMGEVAASGGYWLSLAGSKIYALPTTITGSVGVILQSVGLEKLMDKIGIEPRVLKSGKSKDMGSPFRPLDKPDREFLESILSDMHQLFISTVLEHRNLKLANTNNILDGRVFTGNQAQAVGLVDELSDFYGVLEDLKTELNIPDAKEVYPPKKSDEFLKEFLGEELTKTLSYIATNLDVYGNRGFWAVYLDDKFTYE